MTAFYIHIGIPKTGSSSIQQTLFKSREVLLQHDINYLSVAANHGRLLGGLLRGRVGQKSVTPRRMSRNRETLIAELSANRSGKFVISAEELAQYKLREIREFKSLLDPFASSYRIIVYVRSPYEFASSALMQAVKGRRGLTLQQAMQRVPLPNYRASIEKFIEVYGRYNVNIRVFDRTRFAEGDLISDFVCALDERRELKSQLSIVHANRSVSHEAAVILSEVNATIPALIGNKRNRARAPGFGAAMESVEGVKFALDSVVFGPYQERLRADLEWLYGQLGEHVFAAADPPRASTPLWGPETFRSIRRLVADMHSRIGRMSKIPPALPPIPAEHAAWLQFAGPASQDPEADFFRCGHDAQSMRALGRYLHDLTLTVRQLERATSGEWGRSTSGWRPVRRWSRILIARWRSLRPARNVAKMFVPLSLLLFQLALVSHFREISELA